jgi:Protein of unknown function (DUF2505)
MASPLWYIGRMKRASETFSFACTPDTYWSIFADPEYTRALYLEGLRFSSLKVLEDGAAGRKLHLVPHLSLPGPLAKVIGDSFAYEQHGTLDRARGVWSWRMMPPGGGSKKQMVESRGTTTVVADGEGRCRRTDEVEFEAHLFGLGGLLESTVEKELRASWAKERAFFESWLKKPR